MTEPVRTCAACGTKRGKGEMQRFVWGDEQPVRDADGRCKGRGAYCCRDEICLERFLSQKKKWKRLFRL
ncbi:YlxR family protein [Desulfoprunum benzoelyticum]|uniref:YlxR family protein n=1 Tax=Desulfoprunum benzoelyticum TaxID=1506996 RepID=UPI00160B428D|nr:YlxR family protein [Desulfoprunum benzoelyticum]